MKKILLTLCILLAAFQAQAGNRLQTDRLFDGGFTPEADVAVMNVRGKSLKPYKLDYFRSLRFTATDEEIAEISAWITADAREAENADLNKEDGRLVYALLCFEADDKRHEYIGYQLKYSKGTAYVTVVRMCGKATSKDLTDFFGKR